MIKIDNFIYCLINYGKIHNFIITNKCNNIDNMRKFHNYIKFQLIVEQSNKINAEYFLDIACGRGGDLQKWLNNKLNLKYILAFDNHDESIYSSITKGDSFDGAIARFKNIKKSFKGKMPYINFKKLDILDTDILHKINKLDSNKLYDVISCQFALHYFAETDKKLDHVLCTVSKKLRKGGLFIGTCTDGDLIKNILDKGNVNIPLLTLIKRIKNNYLFYIDTNAKEKNSINNLRKNYFEIQGVSSEFYLFKQILINIANKNNLELIQIKSFYDWYKNYNGIEMSPYEMIISFLNFSFIFIKK